MGLGWEKSSSLETCWLTRTFSGQLSGEGIPVAGAAWYPLGREKHNLKVENYCFFFLLLSLFLKLLFLFLKF